MADERDRVRIAAVGDLHFQKSSAGHFQPLFASLPDLADVLVLCGDLTDYGLPEEAILLAKELAAVRIPIVAVLGNHDFEAGQEVEVTRILSDAGVKVLDGDACEIRGIGFGGTKGFAGGFGSGTLAPWGEPAIKVFVKEAIDEALKLEAALGRLRMPQRIAVLHYAPICATVQGEPAEIFPFLGTSRLEDPVNRFGVAAVFHGHAHRGTAEGRTQNQVPVYNVALPLLRRQFPDGPPLRIIELCPAAVEAVAEAKGG